MLYCTDRALFSKLPFESRAVEVTEQAGTYTLNSTEFIWLCSYGLEYARWRRILAVKGLPDEACRVEYLFERQAVAGREEFKALELGMQGEVGGLWEGESI